MPQQIELFKIDNPCIGVCQSNKKGYCFGCLRNRTERQLWLQMTDEQRKEVLQLIIKRKKRIEQLRNRQQEQMSLDFDTPTETPKLF
ncbi:DUF1289 domain-containing protein [Psychrobacter sp. I-STPA10]|uniref:DUF1289 domain-containing protein n=1 Tax=Psychrobacter sp. I-STPA10 TaxID=2585769 RepID=UPI001E33503A|nr:DUF1289 domain-containing protein [Psychrobacter sp. I-STPA10]